MKLFKLFAFSASVIVLAAAFPASADPGKDKPGKGRGHEAREDQSQRAYTRLGDYERGILRDYYGSAENCPPGLAKKNNGCLPPGIAKKRYEIGRPLGGDVIVIDLPYGIEARLPSLPGGYGYRIVDGDLAVVELATLVVLDAIGLY